MGLSLSDIPLRAGSGKRVAPIVGGVARVCSAAAIGTIIGWSLVTGRSTLLFALLAVSALAIGPSLSTRARFAMLWACLPLTVFAVPSAPVPFGISVSTILLAYICAIQLLYPREAGVRVRELAGPRVLPALMLFAAVAAVPAYLNWQIPTWGIVCLAPLLLFWASATLITTARQAWMLVAAAIVAVWTFVGFLFLAILAGHATNLNPQLRWRFGAYFVSWGLVEYTTYSIWFGTLVAFAVPALVMLLLRRATTRPVFILSAACLLASLALLYASAARGAVAGAAIGSGLVVILSLRNKGRMRVVLGVALALVAVVAFVSFAGGESGGEGRFQPNTERLGTLTRNVGQDANFRGRMTMLEASLRETLADPLGPGIGYVAMTYGYDESSAYAGLLLGTGLMGTFAFLLIVVLLALRYSRSIGYGDGRHYLGVLGLATLACGLVAGVSSDSALFEPVQSIAWWSILGACYFGIKTSDGGKDRAG